MILKALWFKLLGSLPSKDRRSIYEDAQEMIKLGVWWSVKFRSKNYCAAMPYSKEATRIFGLSHSGAACCIIGYIEDLEKEIEQLKKLSQ